MKDVLGWVSTTVLLLTIGSQIYRQWQARDVEGVSPWLFIGQAVASLGLLVYSVMGTMWIFVVLNSAMFVAGLAGLAIWYHFSTPQDRKQLNPAED